MPEVVYLALPRLHQLKLQNSKFVTLCQLSFCQLTLCQQATDGNSETHVFDGAEVFGSELTAKGRRRSDGLADWPTALQESLDDLNTEEKQMLLRVLSKIIANLQDQGSVSVPRMCANCRFFRPNTHAGSKKPHHCDYINSAFSDGELRLDCPEHEAAEVRPNF